MKIKTLLLFSLIFLIAACSNKPAKGLDSITSNLTIVDTLTSNDLGMINCMNYIDGRLFIADANQDKFFIYDAETLTLLDTLGHKGQGPLEFKLARSIVKDGEKIIVNDTANRRYQVLDSELNLEKTFKVPLSWILKNYDDTLYGANAGFMPDCKIFKINDDETSEDLINMGVLFDEQKREQMERPFHFWIEKDDIIIAMEITGELFKISENLETQDLINPFKDKKDNSFGDFQPYKNGFLLYAGYPVMNIDLNLDPTFKSNLLYYENNELKMIYEVPEELIFANSFAWVVNGNFVYLYDSVDTKIYKLKI